MHKCANLSIDTLLEDSVVFCWKSISLPHIDFKTPNLTETESPQASSGEPKLF